MSEGVDKMLHANAKLSPAVAKLQARSKTTDQITNPYFRCLIHGEIDSRKTTTAISFSTPELTRVILTRGEDQLLPFRKQKYRFLEVNNATEFTNACTYCDQIWPDWAQLPDRVLVVDDIARAKDYLVKDNETYVVGGEVREHKDARKIYGAANKAMDEAFTVMNEKPMHLILVSTSKISENELTQDETIFPDLSPGMRNIVLSDCSYIFYINKKKPWDRCLLTTKDTEQVSYYDEKLKREIGYQRVFFARNKMAIEDAQMKGAQQVLQQYEPLDLGSIWARVKGL